MTDAAILSEQNGASARRSARGDGTDDWDIFSNPASPTDFIQAWFRILCRETRGVGQAALLLKTTAGNFAPVARWPDDAESPPADPASDPLTAVCEAAHRAAVMALRPAGEGRRAIGFPVVVGGAVEAIIGMVMADAHLRPNARRLQWGAGWLYGIIAERQARDDRETGADTAAALQVLAAMEDGDSLEASLRAFANEAQALLRAERVSVALVRGG